MFVVLVGLSSSVQDDISKFPSMYIQAAASGSARPLSTYGPRWAFSVKGHAAESSRRSSLVCRDGSVSLPVICVAFWGWVAGLHLGVVPPDLQ